MTGIWEPKICGKENGTWDGNLGTKIVVLFVFHFKFVMGCERDGTGRNENGMGIPKRIKIRQS